MDNNDNNDNKLSRRIRESHMLSQDDIQNASKRLQVLLKNVINMVGENKQQLSSIIFTLMDALNYSVVGGLHGLKTELENIVNEHKNQNNGESSEGMEFIGELANFIAFFLEYLTINNKLKANNKLNVEDDTTKSNNAIKIEYLNNAFKHLAFTYGQLSGRTIYYISKFFQQGGPPTVGYFDPISFGSIGSTLIRASPPGAIAGQIYDSVVDFCLAMVEASKASFNSLEDERKLAGEYMEYINSTLRETKGGAPEPADLIESDTFHNFHKGKGIKYDQTGNYDERLNLLKNKKSNHTSHTIHMLTEKDIEKQINDIEEALVEYSHVSNLINLLEIITGNPERGSIYIGGDKKSVLSPLTVSEVEIMNDNTVISKVFKKLIKYSSDYLKVKDKTLNSIKVGNNELYRIIEDFIITNIDEQGMEVGDDWQKNLMKLGEAIGMDTNNIRSSNIEEDEDEVKEKIFDNMETARVAKIADTYKKLVEIANAEKVRIGEGKAEGEKDANTFLISEHEKLKTKLHTLKQSKFDEIKEKVGTHGYRKYKGLIAGVKKEMKNEINGLIRTIGSRKNTDGTEEQQKLDDTEEQQKLDDTRGALKKMITFIKNRDFGTINNLRGEVKVMVEKYSNEFSGGSISTIRRRIAKTTRRIERSLNNFNNTRRTKRFKSKSRRTRRALN
jgi:hypothetical protein